MDLLNQIFSDLMNNEFFKGGFVIAIITWMGYHIRNIPVLIFSVMKRYCSIHLKVNKGDAYFDGMLNYICLIHGQAESGSFINQGPLKEIPSGSRWHRSGGS